MLKKVKTPVTPVIKFVGRSGLTGRAMEPPASVTDGHRTFNLPDAESQKRGFSLETAEETLEVARLFPKLYKVFRVKG